MAKNTRSARTPKPSSRPIGRNRIGKRLERLARQIKDCDEFVDHVAGLRNRYRHEQALRESAAQTALRQSTRTFHRHAAALALWLRQAHDGSMTAIEREALDRIGAQLHGSAGAARAQSAPILAWLTRAGQAAEASIARTTPRQDGLAGADTARTVAEGLRATFEYHKLKVTLSAADPQQPAAVLLLCAIARDAGDDSLDADAARTALREAGRARPRAAS